MFASCHNSYEDVLSNPSDLNNNEESELMMKEYEDNLSETQPRERLGLGLSLRVRCSKFYILSTVNQ